MGRGAGDIPVPPRGPRPLCEDGVASVSVLGGAPVQAMKIVTCACGQQWRGTLEELMPLVQRHGQDVHNMKVTPEQVRAMAVESGHSDGRAASRRHDPPAHPRLRRQGPAANTPLPCATAANRSASLTHFWSAASVTITGIWLGDAIEVQSQVPTPPSPPFRWGVDHAAVPTPRPRLAAREAGPVPRLRHR
jgi:hypothetical protein